MHKNQTYLTATGEIRYQMTNDYMLHLILQKNQKVLRGLVSSLLHMHPDKIQNIHVENPIDIGDSIDDKKLILDIRLTLNNQIVINLEMQISDRHNWTDRWARLFKATTWEELRMLAKDNEYMDEAAQTLYNYNSDALIREKCCDRETQLFFERSDQAKIKEASEENAKLTDENAALADENATLTDEIAKLKTLLQKYNISL